MLIPDAYTMNVNIFLKNLDDPKKSG